MSSHFTYRIGTNLLPRCGVAAEINRVGTRRSDNTFPGGRSGAWPTLPSNVPSAQQGMVLGAVSSGEQVIVQINEWESSVGPTNQK